LYVERNTNYYLLSPNGGSVVARAKNFKSSSSGSYSLGSRSVRTRSPLIRLRCTDISNLYRYVVVMVIYDDGSMGFCVVKPYCCSLQYCFVRGNNVMFVLLWLYYWERNLVSLYNWKMLL